VGASTLGTGWNEGRLVVTAGYGEAALKAPASSARGNPRRAPGLMAEGEISRLTMGSGEDWGSGYRAVGGTEPAKFQIGNLRASGFTSTGQAFIWPIMMPAEL